MNNIKLTATEFFKVAAVKVGTCLSFFLRHTDYLIKILLELARISSNGTETTFNTACCNLQQNSRQIVRCKQWAGYITASSINRASTEHPNITANIIANGWRTHYSHSVICSF